MWGWLTGGGGAAATPAAATPQGQQVSGGQLRALGRSCRAAEITEG